MYRLGLPAWAFPAWQGRFFDTSESALTGYSRVFNLVEGNTSFYGVPSASTVATWARAVEDRDFRFSFKLPRSVTHESRPSVRDLDAFLGVIEPLRPVLGPLLVQFPASVGPAELAKYQPLFERLAEDHACVVEVRHPVFFNQSTDLDERLQVFGFGRVILDSGALYAGSAAHPAVVAALHEKPDLPILQALPQGPVFVRLVLHPESVGNTPWLDCWADRVARLIAEERDVLMTIHCPDNAFCPLFASDFHERLRQRVAGLAALPSWPVPQQGSLL